MLNIAIRAVRKGGNFVIQNYDTQKFFKDDIQKQQIFVKNIIKKTYKIISEIIHKVYPNHIILNKDIDHISKNIKNPIWIINELDGKKNFVNKFPHFCISIAVIVRNSVEVSAIYDPVRNDLFTATKGQGSQLNGYRARCSNTNTLSAAIIAANLPNDINHKSLFYLEIYKKFMLHGISFRCTGSSILDLAYVASGKIDCCFYYNLNAINFISGKLQVQESGCLISNLKKEHQNINYNAINLISNPKFIRLITDSLKKINN
jgi:myo-inositol-1(or 4)-monophosphatase